MSCRAALVEGQCRNISQEPKWESTIDAHALYSAWNPPMVVTSPGSDKLVVPEEKMADHEEQLSDEDKVISLISPRRKLRSGTLTLEVCSTRGCVSPWIPSASDVF